MEFIRGSRSCSRIFDRILRLCDRRYSTNFPDNSRIKKDVNELWGHWGSVPRNGNVSNP